MGELEGENALDQFVASGRSGRRNALPEIEVEAIDPGAAKLADRFSQMEAGGSDQQGTSGQSGKGAEPEKKE